MLEPMTTHRMTHLSIMRDVRRVLHAGIRERGMRMLMDHACQCGCLYCTPTDMTHGGNFGAGTVKPSEGEK